MIQQSIPTPSSKSDPAPENRSCLTPTHTTLPSPKHHPTIHHTFIISTKHQPTVVHHAFIINNAPHNNILASSLSNIRPTTYDNKHYDKIH